MPIPIDEVHRLIDLAEEAQRNLQDASTDSVQTIQYPELCEVIIEISGWEDPGRLEGLLSINSSILNKFIRMRGVVRKSLALKVADRVRSYLKTEDQAFAAAEDWRGPKAPKPEKVKPEKPHPFLFNGEQWVVVELSSEMKTKINIVSTMLDSIVEHVKHSNLPPAEQALTEIERQQLIAILETTLAVLKGPMIEKGLLKKARSALEAGAAKAVEKGAQDGLGMGAARGRLAELLLSIFTGS
jgi:hypothetical protein